MSEEATPEYMNEVQRVPDPEVQSQEEGPGETSENLEPIDITDPRGLKTVIQDLGERTSTVCALLRSIQEGHTHPNSVDLRAALESLQNEENMMFTDIPSYVQIDIETDKQKNAAYNAKISHRVDTRNSNPPIRDWSQKHDAFVSPQVPLQLPFNYQQFLADNPEWREKAGTYHDLFYGDGSNCPFVPPENNKRVQLEKAQAEKFVPPKSDPPCYDGPPMRQLKVQEDFVPACAAVDNSAAQQRLKELKTQRQANRQIQMKS
eukprot:gene3796-2686_t